MNYLLTLTGIRNDNELGFLDNANKIEIVITHGKRKTVLEMSKYRMNTDFMTPEYVNKSPIHSPAYNDYLTSHYNLLERTK